ncbi:MAG: GTPase, partial [Anaerolineae bacterium]|nr:GTPase [Anaerolineae bacterium]
LELFAFRKEGGLICKNLAPPPKGSLFLFDPEFCGTPRNFAVDMFLAASVNLSLNLPMILVLSKSDTVPTTRLKRIMGWLDEEEAFI